MIQVIFYTDNYPNGIAVQANEDYVSNKFTRYHGKVSANSVDFSVDNSDNTFVWDYVNKKLTVRFIDNLGNEQFENLEQYTKVQIKINNKLDFTGYIDYPNESYDENTLEFTAKDFWFRCENTKVDKQPYISYPAAPLYFNDLFKEYLLKANYEGTFDNVYDINQEIDYFMVEEDSTVADVLNRLVESVGGEVYFNNEGNIVFDGGCFAAQDVTPPSSGQYVITENDISNLSIKRNALKNNVFEVKATPPRKNLDDDGNMILDYVYVGADPDKPIKIGTDTETEFQVEFDENKVFYVVGYQNTQKYWWEFWKKDSEVFKFEATGGITLDQATYNSNFFYNIPGDEYGGGYIKNPSVFDIKLNGADVTDPPEEVTLFAFMGCFLKEDTFIAVVGEPDAGDYERKMELENNVIQTKAWAELLASYLKQVDNNKMTLSFELVNEDIGKDVKVGDYITINVSNPQLQKVDGIFKVETIAYDYAKGIYECEVDLVYSQLTPETANIKTRNDFNFNVPNGFLLQMREEFPFIENRITLTENQLDEIADDSKLTVDEKRTLRLEKQKIETEKLQLVNAATKYNVSYTNYETAYNNLIDYLNTLNLSSNETTDGINRTDFVNNFQSYYNERKNLIDNIDDVIQVVTDKFKGTAPNIPSGLSLASNAYDNKMYVTATWDNNTQSIFSHFEVAFKYEGSIEEFIVGSPITPNLTFLVDADRTLSVRVRSVSNDNYFSDWSAPVEITTGIIPATPDNPDSIVATAGVGLVVVRWGNIEADTPNFSHYWIQRKIDTNAYVDLENTEANSLIDRDLIADDNDHDYTYRLKVVDKYGNASTYWKVSNTVSASSKVDADDIKVNTITANNMTVALDFQGHNISGGTLKSNLTENFDGSDIPITEIDLDNGDYFKMGRKSDGQYIEYKKDPVTGEYNFTLVGGQLEASNALLLSDTDINVTVGSTGDFATLNDALEYMSKFMIIKRADGSRLHGNIYLLSGYEQTEQLSFYDVNLNWVTITSEDINVNVSFSASSIIYAVNSILPTLEIHFDFNNNNFPSPFGFCYLENSFIQIGVPNSVNKFGFSNAQSYGFMVLEEGSRILTYGSTFENIDGIKLQNSKVISKNLKYLNNRNEILCDYNSYVDLGNTDFTGTISSNIIANNLSIVNANSCIFNSSVSPNVEVNGGSQINVTGSTGVNGNIPVNTIDRKGIIFDEGAVNNFANQTDITNKRDFISVSRTTYGVTPTNIEAENYMNTNYSSYPVGTMAQLSHTDSGNTTYFYMIKMSSGWNYLKSDI